jgi:hypothetical protein
MIRPPEAFCVSLPPSRMRRPIPAYAGFSGSPTGPGSPRSVHPHVRGAQLIPASAYSSEDGPSPRAWGSGKMTCGNRGRYLPATFTTKRHPLLTHPYHTPTEPTGTHEHPTDFSHPHTCGEQRRRSMASAGTVSHPHTCGEQKTTTGLLIINWQPSPHMRGAVFLTCNAIPSNPSFLQVVEKQTNPTPLNHPPEHHSPTSLDILVRNRGEGGPDGPTTSGFPAGYRDPARSRPNGADVRAPYPSGRLRYSGGKTAMRSSTSITSTLPRRRAAQMEGSFPHGQLGRGRRPRGIGLLGSAGSVSQKLAIPPRLPRHCVHGTEEAHHHRPSPDRI